MKEIKLTILYCVWENFCDSILLRFRIRDPDPGSGSGTVINYGSGYASGSASQKVTVPTVPVPQRCLSIEIMMIDDGRPLLVHLKSALGRDFPQNIAGVGIARDEDVAAVVHKVRHRLDIESAAEFVHRRREDDNMIEEIFAVLFEGDGRIVCHLEAVCWLFGSSWF